MTHAVVAIPYGLGFRNLVCCGVLHSLAARGAQLTVLLPPLTATDRARLVPELPPRAQVEPLPVVPATREQILLKFLKQHFYGERTALESFAIKKRSRRRETPLFHVLATLLERSADLVVNEGQVDRWLFQSTYPFEREYARLLREWKPNVVVVTKPGYHPDELALLKAARQLGIPSISVDTTWDNMVSKRPPYILPTATTVWNAEMAVQASLYYQIPDTAVTVTGGVQFDEFFRRSDNNRSDTRRRLGLDPARPLVVFALSNPNFTAGTPEFAAGVAECVANGRINDRPMLILRSHPWDRGAESYAAGVAYDGLRIERPFELPEPATRFECLPTRRDVERQGALYRAADVIINTASTTSLDGIAADVPVVNIAFDAVPTHPDLSVARFTQYSHYRPIAESGAVRIARSWDELCAEVNRALREPEAEAAPRARARERFLGPADDRAAERVADAIGRAASN